MLYPPFPKRSILRHHVVIKYADEDDWECRIEKNLAQQEKKDGEKERTALKKKAK